MFKTIYDYLAWSNPKNTANTYEQEFYDAHASLFNMETLRWNDNRSNFGIIKANIVLSGLENRRIMNEDIQMFLKENLENKEVIRSITGILPYFDFHGQRIYIPTYSEEINHDYYTSPVVFKSEPKKFYLEDATFNVINPFEVYGNDLFTSPFSSLVKLEPTVDGRNAYYHVDFETLFFVDAKGDLERELPIFDEKAKKNKDGAHLFEYLNLIAKDYFFADDRTLVNGLFQYRLISKTTLEDCLEVLNKNEKKY